MRVRDNPLVGKAAELVAHHLELRIQTGVADGGGTLAFLHEFDQPRAGGLRIALPGQHLHGFRAERHLVLLVETKILQPHDLALAHRDAAADLPKVFAKGDLQDQLLQFTKIADFPQPGRPGVHLAQAFHISCNPRQAVRRVLVFFQGLAADAALNESHIAQIGPGFLQHGLRGRDGGGAEVQKIG